MAKSQQTFGKNEREKKRLKKREEKQKKKVERQANLDGIRLLVRLTGLTGWTGFACSFV
jgi:hypothetical protein